MNQRQRRDRARRNRQPRAGVAHFEVVTPGMLEVLSVGKGDLRITIGGDEDDTEKARALVEEMLRKGYALFVDTDDGLTRVKQFNPKRMSYVITEIVPDVALVAPDETVGARPARQRRTRDRHVPVSGSRAVAVGRTAGG